VTLSTAPRVCICGAELAEHVKGATCSVKCRMRLSAKIAANDRPKYRCHKCNAVTVLGFSPRIDQMQWYTLRCPGCGE
jgi:hypothetical protein